MEFLNFHAKKIHEKVSSSDSLESENRLQKTEGFIDHKMTKEEINSLHEIVREVCIEENKIGFGRTSYVYMDPENESCYKYILPGRPHQNDIDVQAEIMDKMCEDREIAIVPTPYFSVNYSYVAEIQNKKVLQKRNLLIMERVNGFSFEQIFDQKQLDKNLPENFDFELFKERLLTFVNKMHDEYGIYHCDIAPRNIMIDLETHKPVIIDFDNSRFKSQYTHDEIREGLQYKNAPNDDRAIDNFLENLNRYLTK